MDKSALITNLKIDRDPAPPEPRAAHRYWIPVAALGGVAILALLIWFLVVPSNRPTVEFTQAHAATAAAPGAALLEASGYVVARREATVSSKITGRVMEMLIEEGQHVDAGQVIARLDDSNVEATLGQAQAQVRAAEANAKVAEVTLSNAGPKLRRAERLHRSGWIGDQLLEDSRAAYDSARYSAAAAQRQLEVARAAVAVTRRSVDDTVVRAPFAGVVTVKNAQPGEIVSPGSAGGGFTRTGIGTIVDMHSLEVEVDVAESYINRVQAGMPATVHLNAYPDWEIPAEAAAVIPTGDRSKATVKVRVRFKVEDPRIIPEMGAKVAFLNAPSGPAPGPTRAVEVQTDAILSAADNKGAVFVINDDLRLERRAITLGPKHGDQQTVLAGLRPGEKIALGDLSKLHDGMSVRLKDD
jgi:RND family efflux transporter MFP subunit